jgi:hypothetical protein
VEAKTKERTRKTEKKLEGRNKEVHEQKKPEGRIVEREKTIKSRCRTK